MLRPSLRRWLVPMAPVLVLLAACGGSALSDASGSVASGADALARMKSAGITCLESGDDPAVDTSATAQGIEFIRCDKFGFLVITDKDTYAGLENCMGTDTLNWDQTDKQRLIVGPNFVITPIPSSGEVIPVFPEDATSAEFIKEFGGTEQSVSDWMISEGCTRPPTVPSAAPSS